MTIIILTSSTTASGGTRQALYLADILQKKGHGVYFVCRPSGVKNLAEKMGLRCVDYPEKLSELGSLLRHLADEDKCSVIHAFHNRAVKAITYLGFYWRLMGKPLACAAHRGITRRPGNPLPFLLPGIQRYMVNSLAAGRVLPLFWRRGRCVKVDNSIPEDRLKTTRTLEEMRRELGIPEGNIVLGNVANFSPHKGAASLIRAYAAARNDMPPSTLLLVGVREEESLALCRELGVEQHCRFVGQTEKVADYLQLMSLLVFTSTFIESQPNVILEAMCLGIPAIGSNIGGVPEILPSDCLFDPKSIPEISVKMIEMANDPERLAQLGQMNLGQRAKYSLENRAQVVLSHYRAMLEEIKKKK